MKRNHIPVGKIVNAHGVRGELRVLPLEGGPDSLTRFHVFYLDGDRMEPLHVRTHKSFALMRLPGVETMDDALGLKGKVLSVSRDDGEIPPETYFAAELPGVEVYDGETGALLGEITAVEHYPASDVYTVRGKTERGERTYRIPAVKDAFILGVDLDRNRMDVRVWEGMADDED